MIANQSDKFRFKLDLQQFAEGDPIPEPVAQPDADPAAPIDPIDPAAHVPEEQPKGLKIKYNKEDLVIPDEEVPSWVQKGMNHDRLQERVKGLETQAQMLDRVAKHLGYANHDEFQEAFEAAERDKLTKDEAARLGMDQELYLKYLEPVNQKLTSYEQQIKEMKKQEAIRSIDAEVATLKTKYPDFEQYQEKVFDMAVQKGYSLEDAYILSSHSDRIANLGKTKEQEILGNLTHRQERQILPGNEKPGNTAFDPNNMSAKDIAEISRRVQAGERIVL